MSKLVSIQSENLFGPGIFDITGNSVLAALPGEHAHLTELPGAGGLTPPTGNLGASSLIMTDQAIKFDFHWGVSGSFAHVINPAFEWRIQIFMEQYGPREFDLQATGFGSKKLLWSTGTPVGLAHVNFPGTAGSTTITIPGGTIPEGLYDVVAVIQLYDMPSGLPCFAAAFAEFNKINFYREHV